MVDKKANANIIENIAIYDAKTYVKDLATSNIK